VLPISHDEVVHGKKSFLDKMFGSYEEKFAGVRVFYAYMLAHPGKKLLFMGAELGQFIEWDEKRELDWLLLSYPMHKKLHLFFKKINAFYLDSPALWKQDFSWQGFEWIMSDDNRSNTAAFIRKDGEGGILITAFNFSPVLREGYRIGVPDGGQYWEVLNTDSGEFGGWDHLNPELKTQEIPWHGRAYSVELTLPPLGAVFLAPVEPIGQSEEPVSGNIRET
jgi:1,4-alpha-glucan branching enzyme